MQLKLSMLGCLHISEQAHGPYRSSQDTAVVQESSPHFYESALPRVKLQRAMLCSFLGYASLPVHALLHA